MSDIKSYQRLLAVQALYEVSINKKVIDFNIEELLSHLIENADFKKKIQSSKLLLTKEIFTGVSSNLILIDLILKNSISDKRGPKFFDKLLLAIFRCGIYEISIKKEISKKIVITEYLLISNHFLATKKQHF